ncbi:hypothetical protein BS47DRAFT_1384610 [Hydnum rufescens UP504]|uniref:Uncharacterized protein n=1 Tax=Hydnum rufescens UP504 TaxID=1448309 RepID=A0A9P6AMZ1_9AGAM|nr:hypothetical protein BS47DRAFT_1384610 [Hydnum rufescens UP504]
MVPIHPVPGTLQVQNRAAPINSAARHWEPLSESWPGPFTSSHFRPSNSTLGHYIEVDDRGAGMNTRRITRDLPGVSPEEASTSAIPKGETTRRKGKAPAESEETGFDLGDRDMTVGVWSLIRNQSGLPVEHEMYLWLHKEWWGVPLTPERRTPPLSGLLFPDSEGDLIEEVPIGIEVLTLPPGLLARTGGKLMIRDEYRECYNLLEADPNIRGTVVSGQPGIGKSLFLYYCLARRLSQSQPTVFHEGGPEVPLFFSERGVYRCINTSARVPGVPQGTWALLDSTDAAEPPPRFFVNQASPFYIIHAAFPDNRRYKSWRNQKGGGIFYMSPWSWPELWACPPTAQTLYDIFIKYGPSPRLVYDLAAAPMNAENYAHELQVAVKKLALANVQQLMRTDGSDIVDSSIANLSHALFIVRPRDRETRHLYARDVPTAYLMELILQHIHITLSDAAEQLYHIFRDVSETSAAAGMLFQHSCVRILARIDYDGAKEFEIKRMVGSNPSSSRWGLRSRFDTDESPQAINENFLASSRTLHNYADRELGDLILTNDRIYVPLASNDPTFDFFLVDHSVLYAFQATTAKVHVMKEAGLLKLQSVAASNQIVGRWKWIFVIPPGNVVRCHAPKNWKHRLDLYTLHLDV